MNLFTRDGWCQTVLYASRVSGFLAAWHVVVFTAERYVIVHHPLRKDEFCTKRRARFVVCVVVAIALVLYTPTTWTHDVIRFGKLAACAPLPRHQYLMSAMATVDTLLSCLVPSLLIVVLNGRIIHKLRLYQTPASFNLPAPCPNRAAAAAAAATLRRRSLVRTSVSASGSMHVKFTTKALPLPPALNPSPTMPSIRLQRLQRGGSPVPVAAATLQHHHGGALSAVQPHQHPAARLARGHTQFRTARMLLVLSSLTVLLNLPTHVFRVQAVIHDLVGASIKGARGKFTWQELFQLFHFLNFAVNFFVYSCCGRHFRTGLVRLCSRLRWRVRRCYAGVSCRATSSSCRLHVCPCAAWRTRGYTGLCIGNDAVSDQTVDNQKDDRPSARNDAQPPDL